MKIGENEIHFWRLEEMKAGADAKSLFRQELRNVLSHYLDISPSDLVIHKTESGKPYLDPIQNSLNLQFSFSHSKNLALVMVNKATPIGIDVERVREVPYMDDIINRYFHEHEKKFLLQLDKRERILEFFRFWTIKESVVKACGTTIMRGLSGIVVSKNSTNTYRAATDTERWFVSHLDLGPHFIGAYAIQGR